MISKIFLIIFQKKYKKHKKHKEKYQKKTKTAKRIHRKSYRGCLQLKADPKRHWKTAVLYP